MATTQFGIAGPPMPAGATVPAAATPAPSKQLSKPLTAEDLKDVSLDKQVVQDVLDSMYRKGAVVLYGSPGTGKTYLAKEVSKAMIKDEEGRVLTVQFHPSYSYEEFLVGIRAQVDEEGGIVYDWVDGKFKKFVEQAQGAGDEPYVAILDEINRGDTARILGELLFLLEYRREDVTLMNGETFHLPHNLYVICTMNTADKSITPMDHALRRRFGWVRVQPDFSVLAKWWPDAQLREFIRDEVTGLNKLIDDDDLSIGPGYFLVKKETPDIELLGRIWRTDIEPYVEDILRDRREDLDRSRWARVRGRFAQRPTPQNRDAKESDAAKPVERVEA